MEKYYSIRGIENIDFENPESHITECETLNEAKAFPLTEIIVIKTTLKGRTASGSGFYYPHVYRYKIIDREESPFCLNYKNNRATEYIIETCRSGYYTDEGNGYISILDRNHRAATARIGASYNESAIFVIRILEWMVSFENEFGSNWIFYDLLNAKQENIEKLEKENAELKEKVNELTLKPKEQEENEIQED